MGQAHVRPGRHARRRRPVRMSWRRHLALAALVLVAGLLSATPHQATQAGGKVGSGDGKQSIGQWRIDTAVITDLPRPD